MGVGTDVGGVDGCLDGIGVGADDGCREGGNVVGGGEGFEVGEVVAVCLMDKVGDEEFSV